MYRKLIDSARDDNPNLKLIIIEPFVLPVGGVKEHYDEFMKVFSEKQKIICKIANDYDAVFIPVQKRLEELVESTAASLQENQYTKEPAAYWLWDGIHPTERGHWLIASRWLESTAHLLNKK
jgi:lysophospholipase L1-like esterase